MCPQQVSFIVDLVCFCFVYLYICLFVRSFVRLLYSEYLLFSFIFCLLVFFLLTFCFYFYYFILFGVLSFVSHFFLFFYFWFFACNIYIYIYSILVDMNLLVKVDFMDQVGHVLLVVKLKQHNHLKNHLVSQCLP